MFTGGACQKKALPTGPAPSASADPHARIELREHAPPPLPPAVPPPESLGAPPPNSRRGGSLRVHLEAEPTQLDPIAEADAATVQVVAGLVYEPLIECPSVGSRGGYRPALAESWEVSPDGLRISLHLRAGVRWHDGWPMGPLDAQATIEPLLIANGGGAPLLRAWLQDVATIEIAADRWVRLLLKRPSDLALRALCEIPILPDHLLRGPRGDRAALGRQPVGTGPLRFASWEKGRRIRLVRWPSYWGASFSPEEIIFEIDGDAARALTRTRRGEIDILPRVQEANYPDDVDPVTLQGAYGLMRLETQRWAYLAVNLRHPPLGDAGFRRALAHLWDRARFARDLHRGLAHPLAAPPMVPDRTPPLGGRAVAAAAFEAAGFHDTDADGVRDVAKKAIRLTMLQAAGARTAATETHAFVLEARKAGILIDAVPVEPGAMLAMLKKGDFDLAPLIWQGRPDEDPSPLFSSTGAFNYSGYRSPETDSLLDGLRGAAGPLARLPLYASLANVLERDEPIIPLYRFDVPILFSRRVHGLAAVGDRLDLRRVWMDP